MIRLSDRFTKEDRDFIIDGMHRLDIGAADWYRPGQACKDVTADTIGHDAFYNPAWEPLRSWVPRRGEQFVMFASTPARMS